MRDITRNHPARRATLGDQLRRHADQQPEREALVGLRPDGSRVAWTYAELDRDANRLANALAERGITTGDVVALMARNTPESLIGFYAAMKLGAAITGVNYTFTEPEMVHQLSHSGAKAILVEAAFAERIEQLGEQVPALKHRIVNDAIDDHGPSGWPLLSTVLESAPDAEPSADLEEDAVALIAYTSGTEALPKGVRLPHRSYLISTVPAFVAGMDLRPDDVWYYVMPFHTTAGLGSQIALLALGNTLVLPHEVDVAAAPEVFARERVTVVGQTPTFYLALTRVPGFDDLDFSALQLCITYGGTMPRAMIETFRGVAPNATWCTFWSQSEIAQTPVVGRFRSLDDVPGEDPAWIGRPTPQLETRVVDAEGADAEEGELLCRTPGVMLGYHDDSERTEKVLRDGWLHTGDLVRRDGEGNLFFVDRQKDVIKTGGMNVSSVEVERALYKHDDVLEAAVVGVADEYWSQAVAAFVVAREETHAGQDELIAFCRGHLAGFKVPKTVSFVDELPKDTQGKILKRELRRGAEATETASASTR